VSRQLGVAHILEGSVQRIENAVHVNVQLIRVTDDKHIWAESYNRKLDDVFGVEGEVAATIAAQLNAQLSGAEQKAIAEMPTQNPAAQEAFLRALAIENRGVTDESAQIAAGEYAEAVRLDPQFALAWAHLAVTRSYLYFNGIDPGKNSAAAVKEAADRARSLQPDSGEAWLAQAVYQYRVLLDFPSALQSYREAQKRLPNSSFVLSEMAHLERRLGQPNEAETHYRAAARLDPRNAEVLISLAEMLGDSRRYAEAQQILDNVLEISPGNEGALVDKAVYSQSEGRLKDSEEVLARISPDSESTLVATARQQQLVFERRFEEAIARVKANKPVAWANDPRTITMLGYWEEYAGRKDEAQKAFRQAVAATEPEPGSPAPVEARRMTNFLALAYAGLNEKQKALDQLQLASAEDKDDAEKRPLIETVLAAVPRSFWR
jgi:Tfp pilus assembly protein PilF